VIWKEDVMSYREEDIFTLVARINDAIERPIYIREASKRPMGQYTIPMRIEDVHGTALSSYMESGNLFLRLMQIGKVLGVVRPNATQWDWE
jgi:hypothetical protein